MLNIKSHRENANQNHSEPSPYTSWMAVIKKKKINTCLQGGREIETIVHGWWDCKMVHPLWKTAWRFLNKLKIELSHDPAVLLQVPHPNELESESGSNMYSHVHCNPIHNSQVWREPVCPLMEEWVKEMWCVYMHNEVLFSLKRERNPVIYKRKKDPEDHC